MGINEVMVKLALLKTDFEVKNEQGVIALYAPQVTLSWAAISFIAELDPGEYFIGILRGDLVIREIKPADKPKKKKS